METEGRESEQNTDAAKGCKKNNAVLVLLKQASRSQPKEMFNNSERGEQDQRQFAQTKEGDKAGPRKGHPAEWCSALRARTCPALKHKQKPCQVGQQSAGCPACRNSRQGIGIGGRVCHRHTSSLAASSAAWRGGCSRRRGGRSSRAGRRGHGGLLLLGLLRGHPRGRHRRRPRLHHRLHLLLRLRKLRLHLRLRLWREPRMLRLLHEGRHHHGCGRSSCGRAGVQRVARAST